MGGLIMELLPLHSISEVDAEALRVGPVRAAFLAPGDPSFMLAIKISYELGLIVPILIGRKQPMMDAAAKAGFDISCHEKVYLDDLQVIANHGLTMLFNGEVDLVSKGQMSTNYVYRAVIQREKKNGSQRLIAVTSFWEMASLKHFVILTDPGVNIEPDVETKIGLVKKAIAYLGLFGHSEALVLALSASREIDRDLRSHLDVEQIRESLAADGYNCSVESGGLIDIFEAPPDKRPNILLVPHLVTGNSLVKMDFCLDVKRRGMVMTSRGPVLVPSRADSSAHLVDEISLAVAVASRFKEGFDENL
jgi:phosphotransacetylase